MFASIPTPSRLLLPYVHGILGELGTASEILYYRNFQNYNNNIIEMERDMLACLDDMCKLICSMASVGEKDNSCLVEL
jgi:hypothetical protein